ncbi:hypothetical protein GQ54DRAFT_56773 [Martensiomyces pterosporus]|nr:hypothetical protein GQ54DRAFT_56773 [Martensiomyces pterosporus]
MSATSQATHSPNPTTSTRAQAWMLSSQAHQETYLQTMRRPSASSTKTPSTEPTISAQSQRYLPAAITSFPPSSQRTLRSQTSSFSYNGASSMPASKTPTRLSTTPHSILSASWRQASMVRLCKRRYSSMVSEFSGKEEEMRKWCGGFGGDGEQREAALSFPFYAQFYMRIKCCAGWVSAHAIRGRLASQPGFVWTVDGNQCFSSLNEPIIK